MYSSTSSPGTLSLYLLSLPLNSSSAPRHRLSAIHQTDLMDSNQFNPRLILSLAANRQPSPSGDAAGGAAGRTETSLLTSDRPRQFMFRRVTVFLEEQSISLLLRGSVAPPAIGALNT